jgi:hypothetical protein
MRNQLDHYPVVINKGVMNMKKKYFAVAGLLGAFALSSPALAGTVAFNKGLDSGTSTFQTTSTACTHVMGNVSVTQSSSSPLAIGRYRVMNSSSGAVTNSVDVSNSGNQSWGTLINATHVLQVRRAVPADTNGSFSPGNGVTTFGGNLICP